MTLAEYLKKFGGFLAGFSGSLAGITALLYAAGFIASKSADQTLGLEFEFAVRDAVFYIRRGGLMIASVAVIIVPAAVSFIVSFGLLRWGASRLGTLLPPGVAVASRLKPLIAPASSLTMFALVTAGLAYCFEAFPRTEGLLFENSPNIKFCSVKREEGEWQFRIFAALVGLAAGVAVLTGSSFLNAAQRFWAALAGCAIFLAFLGIPIAYGALEIEADAPRVWIQGIKGDPDRMWLLSRADDGVLIWLEEERKVQWIRADKIEAIKLGRSESIAAVICVGENVSP